VAAIRQQRSAPAAMPVVNASVADGEQLPEPVTPMASPLQVVTGLFSNAMHHSLGVLRKQKHEDSRCKLA
jgi:hypothetical protein